MPSINPILPTGVVGNVQINLPKGEGREVEKKIAHSTLVGAGTQAWDLPRARKESPAARHRGCLDKQAFLCLKIGSGDCTTPCAACFGDSLL